MGLSSKLSCEAGSFSHHCTPHWFFQSEVLRLYFPMLEPSVAWSISIRSCSSQFICRHKWDHPVCQQLPYHESSLPLLPVWMHVSSVTPWLSDFHTVQFSGSSGCFLFSSLLSFFWLCEKAQCIYLCLHLSQKPNRFVS